MATVQQPAARASAGTDLVAAVLIVAGVTQLITGVVALVAPGAFYDVIAAYPPENHHFLMDLGSWQIALGAIAVYGARRPDWRVPLLGLVGLQYLLHAIPHAIHVSDPEKGWQGPFALVAQLLGALLLLGLFARERGR
jgi:hypothetical protein